MFVHAFYCKPLVVCYREENEDKLKQCPSLLFHTLYTQPGLRVWAAFVVDVVSKVSYLYLLTPPVRISVNQFR